MTDQYRRATDEEKAGVCCDDYDLLIGPEGFQCFLGEPEDRTWWRDGKEVVAKLNELLQRLEEIASIIETGDQRLLATDGPCGDQPPNISLAEWRRMYLLAKLEKADATKT